MLLSKYLKLLQINIILFSNKLYSKDNTNFSINCNIILDSLYNIELLL